MRKLTFLRIFNLVILACLLVLPVASAPGQSASNPSLAGFDDYVVATMKQFKVPGVSVAIVRDGQIILSKGYGYRDVEGQLPVTSKTLFAIGSVTKSFSVTMLGTLVDEGKLEWDKPIRDYYPAFRMHDPVATEEMTMRDLVTHRSGLPRHDLVWYTQDISREEVIERLRYLEPNKPFRSTYQYNNLMFMTAGYLGGQLSGGTWEQAVQKRVLDAIGMSGTNFSVGDSQKSPDFAQPYRKDRKTQLVYKIPFYVQGAVGPAGEINSNADDLARYLIFHLSLGSIDGKQIISKNNALQMQTPQMAIPGQSPFKEFGGASYGMAFDITTYRGHALIQHGGAIDGFRASFKFLPNDKAGVIVLANLDGTYLSEAIADNVIDRLLSLDQIDWPQRYQAIEKQDNQAEEAAEKQGYTGQKLGTRPSHDLKEYIGEFSHPAYGHVTIALADGSTGHAFQLTLNRISRALDHFHYDTFQVPANPKDEFEKLKVSFNTDLKGDISSVSMPLEPTVEPIVFTRVPEKRMFDPAFLGAFVGDYDAPGSPLTVILDGNVLAFASQGNPKMALAPDHGTTFRVIDRPGQNVEFKQDATGKVSGIVIYAPYGVAVYKRK
jgi:CubicO group peptidase (beta-lactamase class C family)